MALEPCTREIDGVCYTYMPLGAKRGMRLFAQLTQRLGGSLGAAMAGGGDKAALGANAIGALASQLDPEFVDKLIETFAAQTRVELETDKGRSLKPLEPVLDLHFARRTMAQIQWLEFCLESQYSDFLDWLKTATSANSPPKPVKDG